MEPRPGQKLLGYSEEAGQRRSINALVKREEKNLELIDVKERSVMPDCAIGRGNLNMLHSASTRHLRV